MHLVLYKILLQIHLQNISKGKRYNLITQKSNKQKNILLLNRFRRATHVTPKSYLNFIAGYKSIYKSKQIELNDGALRMDTGLEKLAEASASVEVLKKELALMEKELAEASERAEKVLTEVGKFFFMYLLTSLLRLQKEQCKRK